MILDDSLVGDLAIRGSLEITAEWLDRIISGETRYGSDVSQTELNVTDFKS